MSHSRNGQVPHYRHPEQDLVRSRSVLGLAVAEPLKRSEHEGGLPGEREREKESTLKAARRSIDMTEVLKSTVTKLVVGVPVRSRGGHKSIHGRSGRTRTAISQPR